MQWPWEAFGPRKKQSIIKTMWPDMIVALKGETDGGKRDIIYILDTFDNFETCFCFRHKSKKFIVVNQNKAVVDYLREHYGV